MDSQLTQKRLFPTDKLSLAQNVPSGHTASKKSLFLSREGVKLKSLLNS